MSELPASPHQPRPSLGADQREASERLTRLNGPGELRATVLALMLTPSSQREARAWLKETESLPHARSVLATVMELHPSMRLPWFERALSLLAKAPLPERSSLVEAARRVMSADGLVSPIDRMRWLTLRHLLGGAAPQTDSPGQPTEVAQLSLHTRREAARVTAYLSRMVPLADNVPAGQGWYLSVMSSWLPAQGLPGCTPPDADGFVNALSEVQAMPWMLRPVLMRAWVGRAIDDSPHHQLDPLAAEALRLTAVLLDCPMPPELAACFHEIDPA